MGIKFLKKKTVKTNRSIQLLVPAFLAKKRSIVELVGANSLRKYLSCGSAFSENTFSVYSSGMVGYP